MVAGDRLIFDSRQENEEIISLGVWRINMLESMKKYVDEVRTGLKQSEYKSGTVEEQISDILRDDAASGHNVIPT